MDKNLLGNLIDSINESKNNEFYRLINGLGIRHIGVKAAKQLAKHYKNIDNLQNAKFEDLVSINDIGKIMAESIFEFFSQTQTIDLIDKLKQVGINMELQEDDETDKRFDGMIFVLTGGLENYSRKQAEEIIEKFGGKTSGSVSKKTTYVLAGEDSGSKLVKANKLGIQIINEKQFIDMIK